MKLGTLTRVFATVILAGALLIAPVVHRDGQLWLLSAAAALTVYYGVPMRALYSATAVLLATEILYGGFVGSVGLAFIGASLVTLFIRRYVFIPAWSAREGWRVSDLVRTVMLAWFMCALTVVLSVLIGDLLYGYGQPWARIAGFVSLPYVLQPLAVSALVCVVVRRVTIPFRRAILFGT